MDNVLLQANIILNDSGVVEQINYEYEICVNVNGNHGDLAACTHSHLK